MLDNNIKVIAVIILTLLGSVVSAPFVNPVDHVTLLDSMTIEKEIRQGNSLCGILNNCDPIYYIKPDDTNFVGNDQDRIDAQRMDRYVCAMVCKFYVGG